MNITYLKTTFQGLVGTQQIKQQLVLRFFSSDFRPNFLQCNPNGI
jgi:hypothetical protein